MKLVKYSAIFVGILFAFACNETNTNEQKDDNTQKKEQVKEKENKPNVFTDKDKSFSVKFPSSDVRKKRRKIKKDSDKYPLTIYMNLTGNAAYFVGVLENDEKISDTDNSKALLESAFTGMTQKFSDKSITTKKFIKFAGRDALEAELTGVADGEAVYMFTKIIIEDAKRWQVYALTEKEGAEKEKLRAFVNSFRITDN